MSMVADVTHPALRAPLLGGDRCNHWLNSVTFVIELPFLKITVPPSETTAILSGNALEKRMIPKLRPWSWLMLVLLALGVALGWGWGSGWQMSPLQAQTNAPPPELAPALPMVSGTFQDAGNRFEIGILDGYEVSSVGSTPLFQAPDGSLAYTVVVSPAEPEASDATLLELANEAFGQGRRGLYPPPWVSSPCRGEDYK